MKIVIDVPKMDITDLEDLHVASWECTSWQSKKMHTAIDRQRGCVPGAKAANRALRPARSARQHTAAAAPAGSTGIRPAASGAPHRRQLPRGPRASRHGAGDRAIRCGSRPAPAGSGAMAASWKWRYGGQPYPVEPLMCGHSEEPGEHRIVAGVDGSPSSREALRWAVRQAALTGSVVDAVIAWHHPSSPAVCSRRHAGRRLRASAASPAPTANAPASGSQRPKPGDAAGGGGAGCSRRRAIASGSRAGSSAARSRYSKR